MTKQEAIKAAYKKSTYGMVGITKLDTFANGFDSGAEWQAERNKSFLEWIDMQRYNFNRSSSVSQ